MTKETATAQQSKFANKRFQFELAIPDPSQDTIDNLWIAEITVREGAKFLGFKSSSTLSIDNSSPRNISVAQPLSGPPATWYLLTCNSLSRQLWDKLKELALPRAVWACNSNLRTFVFGDLATLEKALELFPKLDDWD